MSKGLTLSHATSNSCKYKIELTYDFKRQNYEKMIFTTSNQGKQPSKIRNVMKTLTPKSYENNKVTGTLKHLKSDKFYLFFVYALFKDGKWYSVGSAFISTLENSSNNDDDDDDDNNDYNLSITKICYRNESGDYVIAKDNTKFKPNTDIKFKVYTKNNDQSRKLGPKFEVIIKNSKGTILDRQEEKPSKYRENDRSSLDVNISEKGNQNLTFEIISKDSSFNENLSDNKKITRTFNFEEEDNEENKIEWLKIDSVSTNNTPFIGEDTYFIVKIKNHGNGVSQPYTVTVHDENGKFLDSASKNPLSSGKEHTAHFKINIPTTGFHTLKFNIEGNSVSYLYENIEWADPSAFNLVKVLRREIDPNDILKLFQEVIQYGIHKTIVIESLKLILKKMREALGLDGYGVIGVSSKVSGHFIIGASYGYGAYTDGTNPLFTEEIAGEVVSNVDVGIDYSITYFPFIKDLEDITGFGVSLGLSSGLFSADVTNCDPHSLGISIGGKIGPSYPLPVEAFVMAGNVSELEILSDVKSEELWRRLSNPNFCNAL